MLGIFSTCKVLSSSRISKERSWDW